MYSLVTLTRNRPWFVERLLRYYQAKGLKAPLHIADGSDPGPAEDLAAICARFADRLAVRHFRFGPAVPAFQRLKNAVDEVRTPYVAWIGDDDFFIHSRIDDAVQLLERDAGTAAVLGLSLQVLRLPDGTLKVGPYAQAARAESEPVNRLLTHLLDLHSTAYSVRRTPQTLANLAAVAACGWGDEHFHFAELLESALTVIDGRVALLDRLTTVRQTHAGQSSSTNSTGRPLFELLVDGSWERYHKLFTNAIARALRDKVGMSADAAQETAALALRSSITATLARRLRDEYGRQNLLDSLGSGARRVVEGLPGRSKTGLWSRIAGKLQVLRLTRGADAAEYAEIARLLAEV